MIVGNPGVEALRVLLQEEQDEKEILMRRKHLRTCIICCSARIVVEMVSILADISFA
jgi:hypothetical protein